MWPFIRHPDLLPGGMRFFQRHAGKSVFVCRFFGPARAVIPLAAGIMRMPSRRFWVANIPSAVVWAPMLLFTGEMIAEPVSGSSVRPIPSCWCSCGAYRRWHRRRSLGGVGSPRESRFHDT
jgi:membrane protein DedA with SNARE-associated domain